MRQYPHIHGPREAPELPCVAFYKYDGSNIRAEWNKKQGWHKFGTRHQLLDENGKFGGAIKLFREKFSDSIPQVLKDNKNYHGVESVIAFCEYFGPSSIGMWHDWEELKTDGDLVLFDISVHKRGFVLPQDFVKDFGHMDNVAEVVYCGNFTKQFVQAVYEGKYGVDEGVVAKGVQPTKRGRPEHGLWMAKCKTQEWFEALRAKCEEMQDLKLQQVLRENAQEQGREIEIPKIEAAPKPVVENVWADWVQQNIVERKNISESWIKWTGDDSW